MAQKQLSKAHWIEAGLEALVKKGPAALKAEPLARQLGTTKGSFYWHFKDVPAYHAALLAAWEERAIQALEDAPGNMSASAALRSFAQASATTTKEAALEPALRAWAAASPDVSMVLERIERARMIYITELLRACGIRNAELGRALYGAAVGMQDLSARDRARNDDAMGTLVDLMLALR